ncbi:MAG: hypothetical protein AAF907_03470, partial [Planctomycetota bacterium]
MSRLLPVAVGATLLSGFALPGFAQEPDDPAAEFNTKPALTAVEEGIIEQAAVRADAEATLEKLLARKAADVLPEGQPIAQRGDSLAQAIEKFGKATGLPIFIDRPRLELRGLDLRDIILGDQPAVPAAVPVTVRQMLGLLLESVDEAPLTAVNDGGLLRITTVDFAGERIFMRTYDVRDLARFRSTRAASAGLLLNAYAPTPLVGGMGGGLGGGNFRGGGGFGGGGFSLPALRPGVAGPQTYLATIGALQKQAEPQSADRAAAEWEARLKFFEKRLELLPGDPQDAVYGYDFQGLIDVIQSATGGSDNGGPWEEIDGEGGTIALLETGPAGTGRA